MIMKKIFKCFIVALIFSIAYAAMPSSVEAVEVSDKFRGKMDEVERFLRQADEKELEEWFNENVRDNNIKNIAQAIGATKIGLGVMETQFRAEEQSLSEAEKQNRLDEIEELKFGLWGLEAVERRQLELAEAKQQSSDAQKNSANNPKEKTFLDTAKEGYDEYQMRKQAEEREKAKLAEAERQRKIREEEAKKREQEKKQKDKESFGEMIGFVVFVFIISLFMPGINFFIWIYLAIYIWQWING